MKYIKLFEVYSELDDIYHDVNLVFLNMMDYGYNIYVDKEDLSNFKIPISEQSVSISIGKDNTDSSWVSTSGNPFLINGNSDHIGELKDCILRLQDFLSDWCCHMEILYTSLSPSRVGKIVKDVKIEDGKFLLINNNEVINFPVLRLKLIFIRKIAD